MAGLALALSLIATACGGSPGTPVAQVPSTGTSTTGSGSSGGSSSGDPAAYSACMRSHGVKNFPDPDSQGRLRITSGRSSNGQRTGLDPNSPQFKAAQQACKSLQPSGTLNPEQRSRALQQALRFAACMRSHGVPNFPDPEASGGGLLLTGKGIDPNSAAFKAAQEACKRLVPGSPFSTNSGEPQ